MARVLVACEFSGVVRNAFRDAGHDAWSCDLQPAADGSRFHVQADVLDVLDRLRESVDLMIAHPPCTRLCNSGVRWLYVDGKGAERDESRWHELRASVEFFAQLWIQRFKGIRHVAIENPIMHKHARGMFGPVLPAPAQIIQPWQFGHGEIKATCLWLSSDLPRLRPTRIVDGRVPRVHHESPGVDRWKRRSVTYPGIAAAMAAQWGAVL